MTLFSYSRAASWPLWLKAGGFVALLISVDILLFFSWPGIRSLPVVLIYLVFLGYLFNGFAFSKISIPVFSLVLLVLFAIPGLVQNKLNGEETSFYTSIIQMAFAVSVILIPPAEIKKLDPGQILDFLHLLGWIFVVSRILILLIYPETHAAIHELAFIVPLFILPALYSGKPKYIGVVLFFAAVLFLINPRTTMFLVYSITFLLPVIVFFTNLIGFRTALISVLLLLGLAGLFLTQLLSLISEIDEIFKTSLGRNSNASFRQYMIVIGIVEFLKSPFYGKYFSGPTGYSTKFEEGRLLPLHNDLLDIAVQGGLIGVILFLTGVIGIFIILFKFTVAEKIKANDKLRLLVLSLSVSLICGLITLVFNPIINSTKTGFFFYFIIGLSILIIRFIKISAPGKQVELKASIK